MPLRAGRTSHAEHFTRAYGHHFGDHRRERQFISTGGFFLTFAVTRAVTHAIRAGKGPFHNLGGESGPHIHHMTFGIIGNMLVGYLWVMQVGTQQHPSPLMSRITSFVYGAGTALTLDEFALWLNLEDDYWTDKGRESIDAVALFGTLLALGSLGGGVLPKYVRRVTASRHRGRSAQLAAAAGDGVRRVRRRLVSR